MGQRVVRYKYVDGVSLEHWTPRVRLLGANQGQKGLNLIFWIFKLAVFPVEAFLVHVSDA